ncbi:MAG: hypothetical protein K2G29_11505, partial [Muribaculaceae bacterium]|nr:hypothetical protein [Muribaculaceae bacterium]
VRMEIYDVNGIEKGEINLPKIGKSDADGNITGKPEKIMSYAEYSDLFDEGMRNMVEEIFSDMPFKACSEDRCSLCSFRTLCRR